MEVEDEEEDTIVVDVEGAMAARRGVTNDPNARSRENNSPANKEAPSSLSR